VTLDPETEADARSGDRGYGEEFMRKRIFSFKQAVNRAIQAGLAPSPSNTTVRTPTFHMGFDPALGLDKALRLAGELENESVRRRQARR
jgi:hypothetical protein